MNNIITIRAMEPDDLDLLYHIENNSDTMQYSANTMPLSRELLRQYILSTTGDIYTDKQLRLIIQCNSEPVGIVDLFDFNPRNRRAEVGIIIKNIYRRRQIATIALHLLEQYAKQIDIYQLYAIVPEHNEASSRLFTKAGYLHTSTLENWFLNGPKATAALLFQKKI